MTQFTSFVAVEEMIVTDGGQPRRIDVPVEVPQGMKGDVDAEPTTLAIPKYASARVSASGVARAKVVSSGVISGRGFGIGTGGAVGGGTVQPSAQPTPPARPDSVLRTANVDAVVDQRDINELRTKLHRSLFTVVEKLQRKETLSTADQGGFISNGKAEVQVWLTDKSPASVAKLKELGFEVLLDAKSSNLIIGRLPVEKIEALARLSFVKYASPQLSK
jgi:hypothetical protein